MTINAIIPEFFSSVKRFRILSQYVDNQHGVRDENADFY